MASMAPGCPAPSDVRIKWLAKEKYPYLTTMRVSLVEPRIVDSGFQAVAGYSDELVDTFNDKFGPLLVGEDDTTW